MDLKNTCEKESVLMDHTDCTKELTCIICPMGCRLEAQCVTLADGTLSVTSVTGNTCPRGANYAAAELTHPQRTVTSTVVLTDGRYRRLPVITSGPIPKENILDVMKEIRAARATAPITIGQVIIQNVCGLGVDIIASRSIETFCG